MTAQTAEPVFARRWAFGNLWLRIWETSMRYAIAWIVDVPFCGIVVWFLISHLL
jgi:hypothetical protein